MAGTLKVTNITDLAGTGSPTFPNGLDITNLVDPVGNEGDVLTVQADGSIAAAASSGGGGGGLVVIKTDTWFDDGMWLESNIGADVATAFEALGQPSGVYAVVGNMLILLLERMTLPAGSNQHALLVSYNSQAVSGSVYGGSGFDTDDVANGMEFNAFIIDANIGGGP